MNMFDGSLPEWAHTAWEALLNWATSIPVYVQLGYAIVALLVAMVLSGIIGARVPDDPDSKTRPLARFFGRLLKRVEPLLFPILAVTCLGIAEQIAEVEAEAWLIRIVRGLTVIVLFHRFVRLFIQDHFIISLINWVGTPVAVLYVVDLLPYVTNYLDGMAIQMGDIRLSLYALLRTAFFGFILFWLGRISNEAGKKVIRNNPKMDLSTREVMVKLFEIVLFTVIFLMILQVMGINLTALAVFGGALGVGLGFGLQQIASNFVSGIIILLDRSVTIGDFIELEDGRAGTIREMSMRSATLETYDGKDIVVPNEQLITTAFTNWTHNNQKQRYPITFQVAYSTDLEQLFDILRRVVASHPKVLSGDDIPIEERPDAEIAGFGDSGIDILVEFWMEGIDDGPNRVGADLLMMIWMALKENGIEIPFPQREVTLLGEKPLPKEPPSN